MSSCSPGSLQRPRLAEQPASCMSRTEHLDHSGLMQDAADVPSCTSYHPAIQPTGAPVVQVVEAHGDFEAPAAQLAALLRGQRPIADDSNLADMAPLEGATPLWEALPAAAQAHHNAAL